MYKEMMIYHDINSKYQYDNLKIIILFHMKPYLIPEMRRNIWRFSRSYQSFLSPEHIGIFWWTDRIDGDLLQRLEISIHRMGYSPEEQVFLKHGCLYFKKNVIMKKILAIGPHPDDIELWCFGTMCKYADKGYEVHFLVLTKWEGGTEGMDRTKEAKEATSLLKCELHIENLRDRYISEWPETIEIIEKYVREIKPDAVFIPSLNDNHQDHRSVHRAAIVATRLTKEIFIYQSPSTTVNFMPNYYVDITPYMARKMQAVKIHSTQGGKVYMAERAVQGLAEYRAFDIFLNDKYVEAFELLKYIEE